MKDKLSRLVLDIHKKREGREYSLDEVYFLFQNSRCSEVLFVFIQDANKPKYIYKTARYNNFRKLLENEYGILKNIREITGDKCNKFSPEPLWAGEVCGQYFLLESFCQGTDFNNYAYSLRNNPAQCKTIFYSITSWLINLARTRIGDNIHFLIEDIKDSIKLYQQAQSLSAEDNARLNEFCEKYKQKEGRVNCVIQHGDFSTFNMLYDKKRAKFFILDWGYSVLCGLPLLDLYNFFISFQSIISAYGRAHKLKIITSHFMRNIIRPTSGIEDFIKIFYENNWISQLARECIGNYCRSLNIGKGQQDMLFLLFILRHLYHEKGFLNFWLENGTPLFF